MTKARWWLATLVVLMLVGVGCDKYRVKADMRNVFATLTYPKDKLPDGGVDETDTDESRWQEPPPIDVDFQLYALVQLEAVTAYENPGQVAECFNAITEIDLQRTGRQLSRASNWAKTAADQEALLKTHVQCKPSLENPIDRALLLYSYSRVAGAVLAQARNTTLTRDGGSAVFSGGKNALSKVATLLATGTVDGGVPHARTDRPVLAMSGGSANGAFTAGFVFELLSARERALAELAQRDAGAAVTAEENSRFDAMVGTSVGALIAQLLDLYYVDTASLSGKQLNDLAACATRHADIVPVPRGSSAQCYDGAPPDGEDEVFPGLELVESMKADRLAQKCALMKLYRNFVYDNEPRLLCVEPAPATALVGFLGQTRPNFIRFDEMSRRIIDPMLSQFSGPMLDNPVNRTVVAIETEQNQTLGLDERSCTALPSLGAPVDSEEADDQQVVRSTGREYCLSSGVMASVVLPFFARPVRHTYSGYVPRGECGTWLDGGLRSAFPAYRAMRQSRPMLPRKGDRLRVLGIDTGRLDGLPSHRSTTVVEVALNAIGQMAGSNTVQEIVMAQQFAAQRNRDFEQIYCSLSPRPADCPAEPKPPAQAPGLEVGVQSVPALEVDDRLVQAVFVPNDAPPALIAEAGYAFDEYVMRGLFTWGRRTAIQRIQGKDPDGMTDPDRELAALLGWTAIRSEVLKFALEDEAALKGWFEAYSRPECNPFHKRRFKAGRERILENVRACGELTDAQGKPTTSLMTPQYFSCPVKP